MTVAIREVTQLPVEFGLSTMLIVLKEPSSFSEWRAQARNLLERRVQPQHVNWTSVGEHSLFPSNVSDAAPRHQFVSKFVSPAVPRRFIELAQCVACHRSAVRWSLLYQALWRLTNGDLHLLSWKSDRLAFRLGCMERAVVRDVQKMQASLRFTKVGEGDEQMWLSFYQPQHRILSLVAPFFARRLGSEHWAIFTPERGAYWDGMRLRFGNGVPVPQTPSTDEYRSFWLRVGKPLFEHSDVAEALAPTASPVLSHATASSERRPATRPIVVVGEQLGDDESRPFGLLSSKSGEVLSQAIEAVGLVRSDIHILNPDKYEKRFSEEVGERRQALGRTSGVRTWLDREVAYLSPAAIVCLGSAAARAVLGRGARGSEPRKAYQHRSGVPVFVSPHPSRIARLGESAMRLRAAEQLTLALGEAKSRAVPGTNRAEQMGLRFTG